MENTNKLPELTTEEFKKKLEAKEEIKGFFIERITMSKYDIGYPINISECKIGYLDWNKTNFQEEVWMRFCEIGTLILSDATFMKRANFKRSRIGKGRIQHATFKGQTNFEEGSLGHISFHQSVFEGDADFSRTDYDGDATFSEVVFQGDAKFVHAEFKGKGTFKKAKWQGKADLRNIKVENDLEMQESEFHGDLLLNGAVAKLSVDLTLSNVQSKVDFSSLTVDRCLLLSDMALGPKQGFRFHNASVSSIILKRETVEGHIFPENEGKYLHASSEYGFLRMAFQHLNRFDDEDWAYYRFKRLERIGTPVSYNPLSLIKRVFEYFFLDLGCGYGTKPFRTFAMSGVLILLFAVFYYFFLSVLPSYQNYAVQSPLIGHILYSLDVSLTAFSGGYGDLNGMSVNGIGKFAGMVEYLLGVVLIGLFVVAFSRKVIR